ncbi:hypothetical protein N665_0573s0025 [Sinapis alba]|nr:hypothetical protein N665_0573s0025 [Sinapis alba]
MSISKFAIFFIVLVFLASYHECAIVDKRPKGTKPTCSKTPKNGWCCSNNSACRTTKALCEKVCWIPKLF